MLGFRVGLLRRPLSYCPPFRDLLLDRVAGPVRTATSSRLAVSQMEGGSLSEVEEMERRIEIQGRQLEAQLEETQAQLEDELGETAAIRDELDRLKAMVQVPAWRPASRHAAAPQPRLMASATQPWRRARCRRGRIGWVGRAGRRGVKGRPRNTVAYHPTALLPPCFAAHP